MSRFSTLVQKYGMVVPVTAVDEFILQFKLDDSQQETDQEKDPKKKISTTMTPKFGVKRRFSFGKSFEDREMWAYEWGQLQLQDSHVENANKKNILFLSLTHGNEPMGLLSLLYTIDLLQQHAFLRVTDEDSSPSSWLRGSVGVSPLAAALQSANIFFVPMFNIDAYESNLEFAKTTESGQPGCRRTNTHSVCVSDQHNSACPRIPREGVDLNRNFPIGWRENDSDTMCSTSYHGSSPLSEPESRAMSDLIVQHNITALLSFHSRSPPSHSADTRAPLLIHPYTTADKVLTDSERDRFQSVIHALNPPSDSWGVTVYEAGLAIDTVGYTAAGSLIDWVYSLQQQQQQQQTNKSATMYTPLVLETVPPCAGYDRWCTGKSSPVRISNEARMHAMTAVRFVAVVTTGKSLLRESDQASMERFWIIVAFFAIAWLIHKYCCCNNANGHRLRYACHRMKRLVRLHTRRSENEEKSDLEMLGLTTSSRPNTSRF